MAQCIAEHVGLICTQRVIDTRYTVNSYLQSTVAVVPAAITTSQLVFRYINAMTTFKFNNFSESNFWPHNVD